MTTIPGSEGEITWPTSTIRILLPVANIGGELVGVHLLMREGVSGTAAATSVIVEVLLFLFAQYLFLTLGIACLLNTTGSIQATGALRSLIFVAPAGLGVQEAGLIGVGHALGLGSDVATALSLAKRMREILFGLPALAAWQWTTRAKAK